MKSIRFQLFILLFTSTSFAQTGTVLTVDDFINQVKDSNPNMESAVLLEQASDELKNEGNHIYAPSFFSEYSHTYDKRQKLIPTFEGFKTVTDATSVGLNQNTNFGLNASLYYNMTSTDVTGANPAFYPYPNLHVHSLNLQVTQPILKNGFGRSTTAVVEARNAATISNLYQQQFSKKMILADASSRYWQLSVARSLVAVQQNSLERTKVFHGINSKRAKLNLIDSADLVASQAALKQRELELQNALDQEKIYARAFNESRGKNSEIVAEQLVAPTPEMIQTLSGFNKQQQREDVLAVQASIEATRANAIVARDERLPQLDAFGTLSTNGLDPAFSEATSDTFGTDHPSFTVGARLNVPLDFKKNARIRRAYEKQIKGAQKGFERTLLQQDASWNSLNQQWNDAKTRLNLALELKKIQTTKLEKERQRQQQGRSTTYQVFLFEQDLLNVELLILQTELLAMNVYTQMKTYGDSK